MNVIVKQFDEDVVFRVHRQQCIAMPNERISNDRCSMRAGLQTRIPPLLVLLLPCYPTVQPPFSWDNLSEFPLREGTSRELHRMSTKQELIR
jgi:hypothetical protein